MAQHDVKLAIEHAIGIGRVDATFEVRKDRRLLGRVTISQGGIDWCPSNSRTTYSKKWSEFDSMMKGG